MPAFLAGPLVKWLIVGALVAALSLAVIWFRHEATVARDAQAVAERSAEIAAADAKRWEAAAAERDRAIADLTAQLQKITADAQEAELHAIALIEAAAARADATERKLAQLRSQADAATEAERPRALSPYARSGLDWLRCRSEAGPGADPGACSD